MRNIDKVIIATSGVVALLVVGLSVVPISGLALRITAARDEEIVLALQQPAVPGVVLRLHWTGAGESAGRALVVWRDTGEDEAVDIVIGAADLKDGQTSVRLPCTLQDNVGTLLLLKTGTLQVMARAPMVAALPPGPDCLR